MTYEIIHTDVATREDLFEQVAEVLQKKGYVTNGYLEALKEREEAFPTGLKVTLPDSQETIYTAIPHTEVDFCRVNQVIYVRNETALKFQHMINKAEDCYPKSMFFILNNRQDGQTEILANLIGFFTTEGGLAGLEQLSSDAEINQYLLEKGVFHYD